MKRGVWLAIAALVVVAAGVTLLALPSGPEWTTSSPEALAEFEAALDAQYKLYYDEAGEHYRRALELDPDFVMAKLNHSGYIRHDDPDAAKALREEVMAADLDKLTPREQYLINRARAYDEERPDDALQLLEEYLAKYPSDPYILNEKANYAWRRGDLEKAERLYQRLVEISPNWVIAYNQLGYITMTQGRFTEAEEYFKSYRFIAPDQANPHDSLGELFITLGRYDEAEETLEKAIEIKPDFWASYQHLALLKLASGDLVGIREIIARAKAAGVPEGPLVGMECNAHYADLWEIEAWQQAFDERENDCVKGFKEGFAVIVTHVAACRLGEWETAEGFESKAGEFLAKVEESGGGKDAMMLSGMLHHMKGSRLAIAGDFAGAEKNLRAADQRLTFLEAGAGWYKLYNRMLLVEIMLAQGKDAEAHRLLGKVRSVNPVMVAEFEADGLKVLGLGRG